MPTVAQIRHRLAVSIQELRCLADWPSRGRMLALRWGQFRQGEVEHPAAASAVALNVSGLDGRPLLVRPRSSDIDVVWDTFVADVNLPPEELRDEPLRHIVELGTNIGAGLSRLAVMYPQATLLGVEPDPENVALARRNLAGFGDRCEIVESAIWDSDAQLVVERGRREWALVVRPREPGDPADWPDIPARSVGSVLAGFAPGEDIDYLLVDIEGSELRVLEGTDTAWAQRVRSIRVECETEYHGDPDRCARALSALGFQVRVEPLAWGAFVFGVRPPAAATH
jgi:FkbM family methyltransferase